MARAKKTYRKRGKKDAAENKKSRKRESVAKAEAKEAKKAGDSE